MMLCMLPIAVDWVYTGSPYSSLFTGKLRLLLTAAALGMALNLAKKTHWTAGLAFFYSLMRWNWDAWPIMVGIEIMVTFAAWWLAMTWTVLPAARQQTILNWLLTLGCASAVIGIFDSYGLSLFGARDAYHPNAPAALIGNATFLGPYLVSMLGVLLWYASKHKGCSRAALGWVTILLFCIVRCKSSMTYAALGALGVYVIGLYLVAVIEAPRALAFAITGLSAIFWATIMAVIFPASGLNLDSSGRLYWWSKAWGRIHERPWIGWGHGAWSDFASFHFLEYQKAHPNVDSNFKFLELHCEPLEFWHDYGSVGLAIFILLVGYTLVRSYRAPFGSRTMLYSSMFIPMLVDSLGNFVLHHALTGMIFVIGFTGIWLERKETDGKEVLDSGSLK